MVVHPDRIGPIPDQELLALRRLVSGVTASDDDTIPDDVTL
jgi:hypothetical protein